MTKRIREHETMNSTAQGILTLAREVGRGSAFRLLQRRGSRFCPSDHYIIEAELRQYFVDSHLPELLAFEGQTLSLIYELAARAGMQTVLADQDAVLADQDHAETFNIPAGEIICNG